MTTAFPTPPVDAPLPGEDELDDGTTTPLDDVLTELAQPVETEMVTWEVVTRPGYAVRYRTDLDSKQVQGDVRQATIRGKKAPDGSPMIDDVKMGGLILTRACIGILKGGKLLVLDSGKPMTFTSEELQSAYGAAGAKETVRAFYGTDGGVVSHSRALLNRSGLTDTGEPLEADPTQG